MTMMPTRSETTPLDGGLRGSARSSSGRRSSRFAHHYAAVAVSEVAAAPAGDEGGGSPAEDTPHYREELRSTRRRAAGAVGVLLMFGLAVSTLQQQQSKPDGNTYRGMFQQVGGVGGSARSEEDGGGLNLVATNEYGEYDRGALALYGFDMLVEPHKETTISVVVGPPPSSLAAPGSPATSYSWQMVRQEDNDDDDSEAEAEGSKRDAGGRPINRALFSSPTLEVVDLEVAETDGTSAPSARRVTLTEPGTRYSLRVRQLRQQGDGSGATVVVAEKTVTVVCKHVRRELRDLTGADSKAFFSAMREFYTVGLQDGKNKYGEGFANSHIMSAYHNTMNYCFHSGMHFLNAHASFDLWAERSLQMIDPKVALHYWDFTIDAATLGPNWADSDVFSNEMYGSAMNSPNNQYQISEGWFSGATSLYDPNEAFVSDLINPGHNMFGFIDAHYNYQDLPGIARTASYCGLKGQIEFATCNVVVNCFESYDNIYDWNVCMEDQVHASNHGMMGGAFNCNTDMATFQEENPQFGSGLLSFSLEYVLVHKWPSNSFLGSYNDCDSGCSVGEPCGCTCTVDFDGWSDSEVYEFMSGTMSTMAGRAHGGKYIYQDTSASATYEYGFMQDDSRLSEDSTILLLRTLLTLACEPGTLGAMSVGPSNLDPAFWALHPIFEKATQILQLSPTYKDKYDFTWVGKDCGDGVSGGYVDETMPFTEKDFGFSDGTDFLTNQQIIDLLSPSNPSLPYVYDKFDTWGSCTDWDFEVEQQKK